MQHVDADDAAPDTIKRKRNICCHLKENEAMSGIQFVTDDKGRKVAIQIDLKKYGAVLEDFWDGLISESRRKEKSIPYEQYRATRLKRERPRG